MERRASLALVAGVAASLAGCSGFTSSSSETASESPAADQTVADGPSAGTETNPEVLLVRADTDRQPVWLADTDSEDGGRPTPRPDAHHIESEVVDTEARADRLSVNPGGDGTRIASFLSATDFNDETVYLETIRIKECFRLELCRISWQPEKVSTDYARRSRPWDESCAVDEHVFEARLIRIPDAIHADGIRSESTSVGSGSCRADGARGEATIESGAGSTTPTGTNSESTTRTTTRGGEQ